MKSEIPRTDDTEEHAVPPSSSWPPARIARWVIGVLLILHIVIALLLAFSIAFPTPFKNSKDYGDPPANTENIALENMESPAWFFPHETSRRVVLLCHGRSRNKSYMLHHVARLNTHWNVFVFTFRNHADNGTGTTSIGLREADDVGIALDALEARGFQDIVVYGTSMGGAAAIFHLAEHPRQSVRGLLTDGTFAELRDILYYNGQRFYLPDYLTAMGMSLGSVFAGYDLDDVVPAKAIAQITLPFLALHGDQDPIAPVHSARQLAEAAGGPAAYHIYPGLHDEVENEARDTRVQAFIQGL